MPESKFGVFVDVGTMHHFSKMQKGIALAISMGSEEIKGEENFLLRISTHHVKSDQIETLKEKIMNLKQ